MPIGFSFYNQKQNGKQCRSSETARNEPSHLDLHCLHRYMFWSAGMNASKIVINFKCTTETFNNITVQYIYMFANTSYYCVSSINFRNLLACLSNVSSFVLCTLTFSNIMIMSVAFTTHKFILSVQQYLFTLNIRRESDQ